jgi:hypothetical protein
MRVPWIALAIALPTLASAELENQIFTSKTDQLRLIVPRGWRATDQPSYPGHLLWMMRAQPDAHIVLTAEAFTRTQYCSWPITCRTSHDALPSKLACALRTQLAEAARAQNHVVHIGPIQAGPKENEAAGMPSVWFEHDDGEHFFRQAVALTEDRVVGLMLSTSSPEARAGYVRAFEQALRTLQTLTAEEATAAGAAQPTLPPSPDAGAPSPPRPKVNPVGSCTQ